MLLQKKKNKQQNKQSKQNLHLRRHVQKKINDVEYYNYIKAENRDKNSIEV